MDKITQLRMELNTLEAEMFATDAHIGLFGKLSAAYIGHSQYLYMRKQQLTEDLKQAEEQEKAKAEAEADEGEE